MPLPPPPEEEVSGQEGNLLSLAGREFIHVGTGRSGALRWRQASPAERRQGHDVGGKVFYLEGGGGTQFLSGRGGYSLMDSLRNVVIVGHGGVTSSGGKASESDIDRMFPSGAGGVGGAGGGGVGAAAPQWRPGELDLRRQELAQRLDEIRLSADEDIRVAEAAHDEAIALLEMEHEHATGLQAERIEHEIVLENLTHQNNLAELEIRIEAERKNIIYGEVGATKRTIIQEQGAMGRELLQLGPDPFAQAAGLSGQVTRGITPQAQAVGQAKAFINQPLPQVGFDMPLPQMEAALAGMQGVQAPTFGGFGMAKGGTVKTKKGKQQSVIVGEAGKEIVTGSDFTVTPLTGAAQLGGRIGGTKAWYDPPPGGWPSETLPHIALPPLPPAPPPPPPAPLQPPSWLPPGGMPPEGWVPEPNPNVVPRPPTVPAPTPPPTLPPPPLLPSPPPQQLPPNIQAILQGLAPMFTGSIFGQVPRLPISPWLTKPGFDPSMAPAPPINWEQPGMTPLEGFGALGIAPQLVRTGLGWDPNNPEVSGHTFYIMNGKRYYIPGGHRAERLLELGFNPGQVVIVSPEGLNQYPSGGTFTGMGAQAAGAVTGQTGYGALGAPLIEPTSGALLMSPHKIAGNWAQMSPIEQANILSAYQHAGGPTGFGLSPQSVLDMMQAFTPAGRGYGRRIGGIGGQF